jgi:allantoin racemase
MRIWHQSGVVFEKAPEYRAALEEHINAVVGEGVVVDLHGATAGWVQKNDAAFPQNEPNRRIGYNYVLSLHKEQFVRAALQAEAEGYDAFFMARFGDFGLEEIRSLLQIPVIGLIQSSMLFAATLGQPIGFVHFVEAVEPQLQRITSLYGLHELLGPVVRVGFGYADVDSSFSTDSSKVVEGFLETAERAVELGAKVLVPCEVHLNTMLTRAGLSQVKGVPIIDSISAGIAYAEMRARFYRLNGLSHAQTGFYYATPPKALVEGLREQYFGQAR